LLRVAGQHRLAFARHALDDPARDLELRVFDAALVQPPRGTEGQAAIGAAQHEEAALGPRGGDDLVHDAVQHLVQVEGRVQGLGNALEQGELAGGGVHSCVGLGLEMCAPAEQCSTGVRV
jgi:hypothetical protein